MELKDNEIRMLEAIKEVAENAVDGEISSMDIPVKYVKTRYIKKQVEFEPSRNARLHTINKLVKAGLIEVDYTNRTHPRIRFKKKKLKK